MKYIPVIVAASVLAAGCTVNAPTRVVEKPVPVTTERTVVYTDATPAPATTTTVYTNR